MTSEIHITGKLRNIKKNREIIRKAVQRANYQEFIEALTYKNTLPLG